MEDFHFVSICERYPLNRNDRPDTYHIVLDLKGTEITYSVGDCLAIRPSNDPDVVKDLLEALHMQGAISIQTREKETLPLSEFLLKKVQLRKIPAKLLSAVPIHQDLKEYQQTHTLTDFVREFHKYINVYDLCAHLQPILPLFYSIASSQEVVGQKAHLTVKVNTYQVGPFTFPGTCTSFLCHRAQLHEPIVPIYLHKSPHFHLPQEAKSRPIIMIGPGTGIAPFRGFMQERVQQGAVPNWLFFGEKNQDSDFFYSEYWLELKRKGLLRLDCAFSRDQSEKIYVQHKLFQEKKDIWQWLKSGAYLFVCGDATYMAKDVDLTLQKIVQEEGNMDPLNAKLYLKELKRQGRYCRDVY